jgi:hypothetical protein
MFHVGGILGKTRHFISGKAVTEAQDSNKLINLNIMDGQPFGDNMMANLIYN